ncbi:hypothetical protein IRJ41_014018 [Triplophysa rosa]|uniref:Uncharacterized protein n=1 Tax=Triplophysa rosa TaxID=992332 RepID=A0A9W7T5S9_TRIRA|nr:hypothetical protein IRJ41_014018 [Triplophysa rosa]
MEMRENGRGEDMLGRLLESWQKQMRRSTVPALDALQTAPRGDTTTGVSPPAKNSGPERPPETLGCEKALHAFLSSHLKIHPPGLKMITTVHIKGCLAADASSTLPEVDLLELKLQCIIMLG